MLRTQTLIEKMDKKYEPMLKQVNITDFTKCIAQFSGLQIQNIPDNVIEEYLTKWTINKYRFFQMLGNKLRVDIPFEYKDENRDYSSLMKELGKKYPAYYPWFYGFSNMKKNKIDLAKIDWRDQIKDYIDEIVPEHSNSVDNMTITSFFKRFLKAPDEIVTDIGRVYENAMVAANFTISINPVDMILASENPYGWNSCYRLETPNMSSHADGCLAAVLDHQSLITYIWNNEGKFSLYNEYDFKNIRYYRMRMWIAITQNFQNIHFNEIYPGKRDYSNSFREQVRDIVETYVANYIKVENKWYKDEEIWRSFIGREYPYGYGEYSDQYVYTLRGGELETVQVYDELITCPCGCGSILPETEGCDDEDGYVYNGYGLIYENFEEKQWCDYCDDYCEGGNCEECYYWRRENPICELDETTYCDTAYEAEQEGDFDPDYTRVVSCGGHCEGCPLYEQHHPKEDPNAADEAYEEQKLAGQGDI